METPSALNYKLIICKGINIFSENTHNAICLRKFNKEKSMKPRNRFYQIMSLPSFPVVFSLRQSPLIQPSLFLRCAFVLPSLHSRYIERTYNGPETDL